jgi:16S rRNA (uracil1498-N3)-methyltransferase
VFGEFQARKGPPPGTLHVWIGPEGDFSAAEISAIKASGAEPITMGRLVLRTETAAIYSLSVLNYELQYLAGGRKEGI